MDDLEERALKAGIQIAVRTNFINKPANAVANLKVCEFLELTFTVETGSSYYFAPSWVRNIASLLTLQRVVCKAGSM